MKPRKDSGPWAFGLVTRFQAWMFSLQGFVRCRGLCVASSGVDASRTRTPDSVLFGIPFEVHPFEASDCLDKLRNLDSSQTNDCSMAA